MSCLRWQAPCPYLPTWALTANTVSICNILYHNRCSEFPVNFKFFLLNEAYTGLSQVIHNLRKYKQYKNSDGVDLQAKVFLWAIPVYTGRWWEHCTYLAHVRIVTESVSQCRGGLSSPELWSNIYTAKINSTKVISNSNKLKGKHCALHCLMSSGSYALIKDLSLAKELEEAHTLTFIRGKTKWPTGLLLALRSKTTFPKALYKIKFILRAFCMWRSKKIRKLFNLPLCSESSRVQSDTS